MSNESDLQSNTESLAMPMLGKFDAQYRFDTNVAASNFATAKAVAAMPNQSMPTVQVNRDLVGKLTTPNYGPKMPPTRSFEVRNKKQNSARIITNCQNAFSELMHEIGNIATVHQKQEIAPAVTPSARYAAELPPAISAILDRQMPQTEFGMRWEPKFQVFYGSGKIFANNETTNTVPTHDLAHLLIGACGNLDWCPEGGQEEVRLAEYNAVFIENLFTYVYGHIVSDTYNRANVLNATITYMRWFVDVHYSPFPVSAEEAYRRFCWNMDIAAISRLSSLFFALKHAECVIPKYHDQIWELHFNTSDAPPPEQVAVICSA
ncbi:MAG TPA: hypothetical protein VNW52_08690 [Burkholderiaceae bacterium]|jgi:hypothetical protein|nr:hypothetical protein [Burkholderiaceae bacterium]